jgi:hypothetical protein
MKVKGFDVIKEIKCCLNNLADQHCAQALLEQGQLELLAKDQLQRFAIAMGWSLLGGVHTLVHGSVKNIDKSR